MAAPATPWPKIALIAAAPIALMLGCWLMMKSGVLEHAAEGGGDLVAGKTYAVWVKELEVAPRRADGSAWDLDQSAPDLAVAIGLEGHELLRTVVADNSMVATWDAVALKVSTLLKGEISRSEAQRLAKFRAGSKNRMSVGVFDHDLLSTEAIGGTSFGLTQLHLGLNKLSAGGNIRHLLLVVEDADGVGSTDLKEGGEVAVKWTDTAASELTANAARLSGQAQQTLDELSVELQQGMKQMNAAAKTTMEKLAVEMEDDLNKARTTAEEAARRLRAKLDEVLPPQPAQPQGKGQ